MIDVLTGNFSAGDFIVFTRKQANVVYAAYKRGDVRMTRQQVRHLYNCVGKQDFAYDKVVGFVCKRRYDLAQAILDGHEVEEYQELVGRVPMSKDNMFYEFIEPEDRFDEVYETRYRIV